MSTVLELHNKATELDGYAYVARLRGNFEEAREYARKALPYETQAAEMLTDDIDAEPSRSVLFRSAASLAMQCEEWAEAERLIQLGLSDKPPKVIAGELRELLEEVHTQTATQRRAGVEKQHTA